MTTHCKTALFTTRVMIILLIMAVGGCSRLNGSSRSYQALSQFPLLTPESYPLRQQVNQAFTIRSNQPNADQQQSMIAVWSTPDTRFLFSALTPTGHSLMSAKLINGTLTSEKSSALPDFLSPRDIISQLQITYWPIQSIQAVIENTAWSISEKNDTRTLYFRNEKVMESEKFSSLSTTLTHHLYGFTVDIKTLKTETLP